MFDFDGALREVLKEREDAATAEAKRKQQLEQMVNDLKVPLQVFIDKYGIDATINPDGEKLLVTLKGGGTIIVRPADDGRYQISSKGSVYTGPQVTGSDLGDQEVAKSLADWLTAKR